MAKEHAPNITEAPRVTIAFPFSSIQMHDPTENFRELSVLVAELAELIAKTNSSDAADVLADRAHALVAKLG